MTRLKIIAFGIASGLLLHGCSTILEPVSLVAEKQRLDVENVQEEFDIKIQSLTFKSAQEANNAPYQRLLMQTGTGSAANVFDEADFITSIIPPSSQRQNYLLGIGDQLQYTQLNEFLASTTQLPTQPIETDYLLGVGDELTFIQLNEGTSSVSTKIPNFLTVDDNEGVEKSQTNERVLMTSGLIGSDGNILLLGLGSIKAENRSLNDIQTEIRNILIRNGLAPSFQLGITGFNSKKAFVTFPNSEKVFGQNVVLITNLPVTLKELAIKYGVSQATRNKAVVALTRNGRTHRITSRELFDRSTPPIIVQDKDTIEINEAKEVASSSEVVVGSRGKILIPGLGNFRAENRSLIEVQADITRVLTEQGLIPNFQLEVTGFKSKKFFIVSKKYGSKVVPLESAELDLKDAILENISVADNSDSQPSDRKLTVVKLTRNGNSYRMTLPEALNGRGSYVKIQEGDHIELIDFEYKPGQVFALSGAGKAKVVLIDPSKRETLADILFTEDGALSNVSAKRSEVYLLRGQSPSVAYHLDAQNVSRILVASKTELRPNDIVFVADRPIISFARILGELSPLQTVLRDINRDTLID